MKPINLIRMAAFGGILSVVLQMTGQMLIQIGGQEPAFNADADEILSFFMNRSTDLAATGSFLSMLSFIPFMFFLGILWKKLKMSEGKNAWLSLITIGSGLLIVAVQTVSGAGWTLLFNRMTENSIQDLVVFQFDYGNYLFSMSWVFMASMLLSSGLLSLSGKALPKWIGILGLITAVALLIATAYWFSGSEGIFMPVMLYWVWLISVSVYLMMRAKDMT